MRSTTALLVASAAALPLAGCRSEENARVTLGQHILLGAFDPERSVGAGAALPPGEGLLVTLVEPDPETPPEGVVLLAEPPEPSLVGTDRAGWGRTVVLVPVDHTFHAPTYKAQLDYLPRTEPTPYDYPTPVEAVQVPEGGIRGNVFETIAAPVLAVSNAALILPWAIVEPPWTRDFSPEIEYERYWTRPQEAPFDLEPRPEPQAPADGVTGEPPTGLAPPPEEQTLPAPAGADVEPPDAEP